jgi:hypothetical protein
MGNGRVKKFAISVRDFGRANAAPIWRLKQAAKMQGHCRMDAAANQTAGRTVATTAKRQRPKGYDHRHLPGGKTRRLKSIDDIDQRTVAGRRAIQLVSAIEQDLGGVDNLSACTKQLIQRAAVLAAMIESSEAQWLSGKPIDLSNLLAAIGVQRRVLISLGLERRTRIVPSLNEWLAEKERVEGKSREGEIVE